MTTKKLWIIIEPYVFINAYGDKAMLYNSLNGKKLIYDSKTPKIVKLIKKIVSSDYTVQISHVLNKDKKVIDFIRKIKNNFFGDIISSDKCVKKPFVFQPTVKVQTDKSVLKYDKVARGNNILSYLNEITFYLNSSEKRIENRFKNAYLQFQYVIDDNSSEVFSSDIILRELDFLKNGFLNTINICGGSILDYKDLKKISGKLNGFQQIKKYYLLVDDLYRADKLIASLSSNSYVVVLVDSRTLRKNLNTIESVLRVYSNIKFHFIVSNENDLQVAKEFENKFPTADLQVLPFWSGRNLTFFKKYVYIKKSDLAKVNPSVMDIFKKKEMNTLLFGKITILNDGAVYSCTSKKSLGRLGSKALAAMIQDEVKLNDAWFLTRQEVSPCKRCVYNFLCPSINRYEIVSGKSNMCLINQ